MVSKDDRAYRRRLKVMPLFLKRVYDRKYLSITYIVVPLHRSYLTREEHYRFL